jgi:hypothetical protein
MKVHRRNVSGIMKQMKLYDLTSCTVVVINTDLFNLNFIKALSYLNEINSSY